MAAADIADVERYEAEIDASQVRTTTERPADEAQEDKD